MGRDPDRRHSGLTDAAGRAAFVPVRAAARAWRGRIEETVDDVLSGPELARIIDRALAGPLPEEIARSMARHRVIERVMAELAANGELERILDEALASPRTAELTRRAIASKEAQDALLEMASSPVVREALTRQTAGFADEVTSGLRDRTAQLDDRVQRTIGRRAPAGNRFAGLATRTLALVADAFLIALLSLAVVGGIALVASLVGGLHPDSLVGALLGASGAVIAGAYFVLFWSAAGQTPGMRLTGVRVHVGGGSEVPGVGRSVIRLIGLVLSIVPMFLGFVPVLFDARRRGLADYLAGTVVVYDGEHA